MVKTSSHVPKRSSDPYGPDTLVVNSPKIHFIKNLVLAFKLMHQKIQSAVTKFFRRLRIIFAW